MRTVNTLIGGAGAGEGNVISGNAGHGIRFANGSGPTGIGNLIQGNFIGTNAAGTAAVPNIFGIGIESGQNNTIGGTTAAARNIISGNSNAGLIIGSGFSFPVETANVVQGNFIGTDVTGTAKIGNGANGVLVGGVSATGVNTIGGSTAGAGNIISGNACDGVLVSSSNNTLVQGNLIGTDVNGTGNLGNVGSGIELGAGINSGNNNTISGVSPGAGNVIAFNGGNGVIVESANVDGVPSGFNNSILGNAIFSNTRLGIDLHANGDNAFGVTANHPCGLATGANNLQNYPVLKSVTTTPGNVNITGALNSTANTTFRLEFFGNDVVDPSGFGQGRVFLGFANVTTDATCDASFNVNFPTVSSASHVTATATDPSGNTSEFSAAIGQLLNISTRLRVQTGENVLIGGFIVTGTDPKRVIVRAIGPSLSNFFSGALADPTLELHDGTGAVIATNDNWKDSQQAEIEATTIAPTNDLEAAIVRTLPANNARYTAIVRGKNDTTGIGLVEAYDLDTTANSKLANISTRGFVETGNNVLIGGFIAGNGLTKVIIRGIGPSLVNSGITNALQDPTLELHDGNGTLITSNDNWRTGGQEAEIIATTIPPTNDLESAIVATLAPGRYTAIVGGKNNTTGVGLVEVYNVP